MTRIVSAVRTKIISMILYAERHNNRDAIQGRTKKSDDSSCDREQCHVNNRLKNFNLTYNTLEREND